MTDNSVSEQKPKNILTDITNKYYNIFIDKLRLVEEAKNDYRIKDQAYLHAAEETKAAEQAVEEARSVYEMAEEITRALLLNEKENSGALPFGRFSPKTAGECHPDSSGEAADIKNAALLDAQKAQAHLKLALAMARLKAGMKAVDEAQANEARVDTENKMHIADAVSKISFAQLESLHYFDSAREIEESRQGLIKEQHTLARRVMEMRESDLIVSSIREKLPEKLAVTKDDLLPYEEAIRAAVALEREAEQAYRQALSEVEDAHALEVEKRNEADHQERDIQAIYDFTQQEYQRIVAQCHASLKSAQDNIEALKEESVNKWERARYAEKAVIQAQNEVAEKNLGKTDQETAIFETVAVKNELVRKLASITRSSEKDDAENTGGGEQQADEKQLDQKIEDKTVELVKKSSRFKELAYSTDQLIQAAREAKEAAMATDKAMVAAQSEYSQLESEMEKRIKLAKEALDRLCAASADKARASREAEEECRAITQQLITKAANLELDLTLKKKARIQAEEERDAAKARIYAYIEERQKEAFRALDQYQEKMQALWQQSEDLRQAAAERRSEIEHFLATSRQALEKERQCIDELNQVIEKADHRIKEAHLQTASILKQFQPCLADIDNCVNEIERLGRPQGTKAGTLIDEASQLVGSFKSLSDTILGTAYAPYKADYSLLHIPELNELNLTEPIIFDQPLIDMQELKAAIKGLIDQLIEEQVPAGITETPKVSPDTPSGEPTPDQEDGREIRVAAAVSVPGVYTEVSAQAAATEGSDSPLADRQISSADENRTAVISDVHHNVVRGELPKAGTPEPEQELQIEEEQPETVKAAAAAPASDHAFTTGGITGAEVPTEAETGAGSIPEIIFDTQTDSPFSEFTPAYAQQKPQQQFPPAKTGGFKPEPMETGALKEAQLEPAQTGAPIKTQPEPMETGAPIETQPEPMETGALSKVPPVIKLPNKHNKRGLWLFGKKDKAKDAYTVSQTEETADQPVDSGTEGKALKSKAEIEAARISAEIEAMRRELASVTFRQRKAQEALEKQRQQEQAKKRLLAEKESAHIRAMEEKAQKAAEEEEAKKMEEQRLAALETERIAQSLAAAAAELENKEVSSSVKPSADPQKHKTGTVTPAYGDDDDSDWEIELRRLIISDFNKNN